MRLLFTLTSLLILLQDFENEIIVGATHTSSNYMSELISQQLHKALDLDAVEDPYSEKSNRCGVFL